MIIRDDNLEILKALLPRYEGRVQCIYKFFIDRQQKNLLPFLSVDNPGLSTEWS